MDTYATLAQQAVVFASADPGADAQRWRDVR